MLGQNAEKGSQSKRDIDGAVESLHSDRRDHDTLARQFGARWKCAAPAEVGAPMAAEAERLRGFLRDAEGNDEQVKRELQRLRPEIARLCRSREAVAADVPAAPTGGAGGASEREQLKEALRGLDAVHHKWPQLVDDVYRACPKSRATTVLLSKAVGGSLGEEAKD